MTTFGFSIPPSDVRMHVASPRTSVSAPMALNPHSPPLSGRLCRFFFTITTRRPFITYLPRLFCCSVRGRHRHQPRSGGAAGAYVGGPGDEARWAAAVVPHAAPRRPRRIGAGCMELELGCGRVPAPDRWTCDSRWIAHCCRTCDFRGRSTYAAQPWSRGECRGR